MANLKGGSTVGGSLVLTQQDGYFKLSEDVVITGKPTFEGDLTLASGVDILHSGTNANKSFYFASDAWIGWDETNDYFYIPKDICLASGVDFRHTGTNADRLFYFASDAYIKWDESNDYFYCSKGFRILSTFIGGDRIEINELGSGDRNAYIDFHNADSPSDYTARIINPGGGNPDLDFIINATGVFTFNKQVHVEAGGLRLLSGAIIGKWRIETYAPTTEGANNDIWFVRES